ncbi:MAG: translation initiation factor IF-2 [Bdellovibrionales bacterium]|nr:translation initiation factor IF-2 [Bdellovibrionales bacterium]
MTEQTQELKVYELAKELGFEPLALLDKLKKNGIEVKSHMSSLAPDQVLLFREALRKEKEAAAPSKPKTAVKRAASTAKKSAKKDEAPAADAGTSPAPAKKKTAKPAEESPATGAKRKVIKRRTGAEGGAEEDSGQLVAASTPETQDALADEHVSQDTATHQERTELSSDAPPPPESEPIDPKLSGLGTKVIFRTPGARVVEKDELMDEFVGRRLKIVKQATPEEQARMRQEQQAGRPTYRTPGAPAPGTAPKKPFAPRAPGAAPAGTDMFQPYTSVVKEEEGRKRGGTAAAKQIEDVRISDFRKRELVFQPKRKKLTPGKMVKKTEITTPAAHKRKIRIEEKVVVSEFAQRMGEKVNTIIQKLVSLGVMAGANQTIDFDTAALIAGEFGYGVENVAFQEQAALKVEDSAESLRPRPPIVTVMGHVDHGKTSLLDAIRNAKVAEGEAGGITQHIGAYSVMVNGKPITFLDTPGHAAFANMRARGANVTDIVVLVVAADDSIMPQTIEAIQHATAAKVPIVVAANKIDKPAANLDKLKKDLSQHSLLVEEWGGEVPLVPVSAIKKTGIDDLLETIGLQAEVLGLQANPDRTAEGVVLEARMEKGRGVVTDVLVRHGTLNAGDSIVVGTAWGRVRAMMNDRGQQVKEVLPGYPVEIIGLNEVPSAGDQFHVTKDEATAKEVADNRRKKIQEQKAADSAPKPMTLDDLMAKIPSTTVKTLNLLVKADVFGSAEAIKESIEKIDSEKVRAKVLHCGVGVITENDVLLAKAAGAVILGFNSKPDAKARDTAKREQVDIRHFSIIYELLDNVKETMESLLDPIRKENYLGRAEVKQVFTVSKLGTVAGSMVVDGKISRNAFAKVKRGKDVVCEGKVVSLKRFKDDASETIKGQECGIGVENFEGYMPGDVIEAFHVELVKQTL